MTLVAQMLGENNKFLGNINYKLVPIGFNINEVEDKYLYRERVQIVRDKYNRYFQIEVVNQCEMVTVEEDYVIFEEDIMMDVESSDYEEAYQEAYLKINNLDIDMPYICLRDLNGQYYTFAVYRFDINWNEFIPC